MNIYLMHKCLLYACVNLVKYGPYEKETRKLRVIYKKRVQGMNDIVVVDFIIKWA